MLLLVATPILAACPAPEEPPPVDPDLPGPPAPPPDMALPDTTGEAVWEYLQAADYPQWRLWPGTTALEGGTEPHGVLLNTHLNETALAGLARPDTPLPDGSIIVKESYDADTTLVDITVMYVVDGYNPRHADLFWARYAPDGQVELEGRVAMCQDCHQTAPRHYLMTHVEPRPPEP